MPVFKAFKAYKLQKLMARKVAWEGKISNLSKVVGLDLAFVGREGVGVAALLNYPELKLIKYAIAVDEVPIPYVPGLLAFREAPLMFAAYEALHEDVDLIMVDGHGVTHPRGLGIASHIGLVMDKPSIGAAKKPLYGSEEVIDGVNYVIIDGKRAAVVMEVGKGKRIYLSIGHKVGIDEIVRLAPTFFRGHSLPEPTYVADRISKEVRRRVAESTGR